MLKSIDSAIDRQISTRVLRSEHQGSDRFAILRNVFLIAAATLVFANFLPTGLPPFFIAVEYGLIFVSLYVSFLFHQQVGRSDDPSERPRVGEEAEFLHEQLAGARKGTLAMSTAMFAVSSLSFPVAVIAGTALPALHNILLAFFFLAVTIAFYTMGAPLTAQSQARRSR